MQLDRDATEERAELALLDELIQPRIQPATRYTFFFTSGEGRYLPGTRIEESSGYVLDQLGRVYFYWLGWDAEVGAPALIRWRTEVPSASWQDDAEYGRARARLGLA